MRKIVLIILIIGALLVHLNTNAARSSEIVNQIHAVRVLNATEIHEGEAVRVYTIMNNPETWTLYNLSCYFLIKPAVEIEVVSMFNISGINTTHDFKGREYLNVSIFVKRVKMKSKIIHWVDLKFGKNGTYMIYSSKLHGIRVKGELKEEFELQINNASIEVKKGIRGYPPEGTKDGTLIVLFATLLPFCIIGISNKITRRKV